jgi:sec-independent protein translocase protein TatA
MPGFGSLGIWEVLLILVVLLLVFGARRLPEIGAALGKGIREFKGSIREIEGEINRPPDRQDLPRRDTAAPPRSEAPPREMETTRRAPEPAESTQQEPSSAE